MTAMRTRKKSAALPAKEALRDGKGAVGPWDGPVFYLPAPCNVVPVAGTGMGKRQHFHDEKLFFWSWKTACSTSSQ